MTKAVDILNKLGVIISNESIGFSVGDRVKTTDKVGTIVGILKSEFIPKGLIPTTLVKFDNKPPNYPSKIKFKKLNIEIYDTRFGYKVKDDYDYLDEVHPDSLEKL